jgi:hypothetical protein
MAAPEQPEPAAPAPATPNFLSNPFILRLGGHVGDILIEIISTMLLIAGIALADKLLEWSLGKDKKFFDAVPVQWVFDFGHISMILRFLYRVTWPPRSEP